MEVQKEMFLTQMGILRDTARDSEVLNAVRKATPESRAKLEKRLGPVAMAEHIIAAEYSGGWVENITLTEDGRVEKVRHEGGSEEAGCIRHQVRDAIASRL